MKAVTSFADLPVSSPEKDVTVVNIKATAGLGSVILHPQSQDCHTNAP